MTYVVGIMQDGMNAIISDTRVSFTQEQGGANTVLKSGLLFPGCIYGASGSASEIRKFIISCKQRLTGCNTVEGFWNDFLRFASSYDFPPAGGFELMLSSRAMGKPKLFLLDSSRGIREAENLTTLGNGKKLLDHDIKAIHERIKILTSAPSEKRLPSNFYPYLYCLGLIERSRGFEASMLEQEGVGGYFHFCAQSDKSESRQEPAVYVLSEAYPEQKEIRHWILRVSFAGAALVIDCPIENARMVLFDSAAWPKIDLLSATEKEQYLVRINEMIDRQPYYRFCGFGFLNPSARKSFCFHVAGKDDCVITRDGKIQENFRSFIESNFESKSPET